MASPAGETPYPIIKANATWGDSFAALNGSDGLAIGAYTAFGAGGGYYFGRQWVASGVKILKPGRMAAIIGGTALLLGTLKQTVYSCERLMGYRDNGLKPLQWEYERFPNAPAMAIRGLKELQARNEEFQANAKQQ